MDNLGCFRQIIARKVYLISYVVHYHLPFLEGFFVILGLKIKVYNLVSSIL